MITPDQIRAARALKGWSQGELAARTGLAVPTIANIEIGKQEPSVKTMDKIVHAFEMNGIEFLDGEGVKKRKGNIAVLRGQKGFDEFYERVHQEGMTNPNSTFLLNNIDERKFEKWMPKKFLEKGVIELFEIAKIKFLILAKKGDTYFPYNDDLTHHKWIPEDQFDSVSFYVFNDKIGIFFFHEKEPIIFLLEYKEATETYANQFYSLWEKAEEIPNKKAGK